jgi:RNA polymerase sigma factor (sigma-70 family)
MNDAILLRAAPDNEAAFEAIYRKHAPRLYEVLRRSVGGEVALDLVAETFAQLLTSAHRFRGMDDFAALGWLNAIARNLTLNYLRRERVEARARRRLEIDEQIRHTIEMARESEGEFTEEVGRALTRLSAKERHAIELRVVEGLSYENVGRKLKIRPDAARTRVSRGLRAMAIEIGGSA